MTGPSASPRRLLLLIFIASLSSLAYELALVRIFSITLWYHFAFMVISIAMLGIGASGTLLAVAPALRDLRKIPLYGLFLAVAIPVSYLLANRVPFDPARLAWDRLQVLYIGLYYLVLSVPFLCFGLIISTALSSPGGYPGSVYASDLLGAGSGSLLTLFVLFLGGPEQVAFLTSLLVAAGLLFSARRWLRRIALCLLVLDLSLLVLQPAFIHPALSPYKPLEVALRFPGAEPLKAYFSPYARVDVFKSPATRYAPGLSLTYLDPLPGQTGISVDGGDLDAIMDEDDRERISFVRYLPSSLPYLLARNEDALVLDPRGGLAVLQARQMGMRQVFAVESNPLLLRVVEKYRGMTREYRDAEELRAGLGRVWLSSTSRSFDVIDLSLLGAQPASSVGFAEDYRLTREAFRIYLAHLKPGGFLSLNLYLLPPPRMELRLLATLAEAAEAGGIRNISSRVAAIRSWGTVTLLFKNGALTREDIYRIRRFCREQRFDIVCIPGLRPQESNRYVRMQGTEYSAAFVRLLDPGQRRKFLDRYLFDIAPVGDDNPFVHYYLKFTNIGTIYRIIGQKWQYFFEEGYLLPVLFGQVLLLSVIIIVLPLLAAPRREQVRAAPGIFIVLSYFAAIGFGFLFIETVLIQKMVLVLEHPPYAAATVIASLLIGSGTGSFASQVRERLRRPSVLLAVAGVGALSVLAVPLLIPALAGLALPVRFLCVSVLFLPLGFSMGIPLPLGIALLKQRHPDLVPWAWAVNGCCSVLAPVLAITLALSVGMTAVMSLGCLLYAGGYVMLRAMQGSASGA